MTKFFYQISYATVLLIAMTSAVIPKNMVYENNWAYLADTVMGGVSQGTANFSDGAIRLSGQVSTKNNGGFIHYSTCKRGISSGLLVRGLLFCAKMRLVSVEPAASPAKEAGKQAELHKHAV